MPPKTRFQLPELDLGDETLGQRVCRLRKARGLTQARLAKKIGIIQALISDYERDKIRMHAEMVVRFALALDVSADELLGLESHGVDGKPPKRLARCLDAVAKLPLQAQVTVTRTIDALVESLGNGRK